MRSYRTLALPAFVAVLTVLAQRPADGQLFAERIATGLSKPVLAVAPPGDTERIFVVEQGGGIRIVERCEVLSAPFIDLSAKILPGGERGLLGLAFHPDYDDNRQFYVNYTMAGSGATIVEQYLADANDPNLADPASAVTIIGPIVQPAPNHNGGMLAFGLDGKLYIGMGDGGTNGTAQSGLSLLGKFLRLDVDLPFPHIPPDNPFVGDPNVLDEIWSLGWRNPWRFSVDRDTGDLYVGDVGSASWEEISFESGTSTGGANFGWPCMEGSSCTGSPQCTCNAPELTLPIDEYDHDFGCAVTGGFMYRGSAIPSLNGTYFYADFCSTRIWSFTFDGVNKGPTVDRTAELEPPIGTIARIAGFGETGTGELLILDHTDGEVYRVVDEPVLDCNNNNVPDSCDIAAGTSTDFNGNDVPDECEDVGVVYCTAKTNSCGTLPSILGLGTPSASSSSGFDVVASEARGGKRGLLVYTDAGRAAIPFNGGLLCVQPAPLRRAPPVQANGTPSACNGVLVLDVNAFASGNAGGNPAAFLSMPGAQVNMQWFARDTLAQGSLASDGLEYTVGP